MSIIKDGVGTGKSAKVNLDNQLEVHASIADQIHWYSKVKGQAYAVVGVSDTLTAATVPILHFKNTSTTKELVIESINMQSVAEAATIPASGIYFQVATGRTFSSVGTLIVPVNVNTGSGNAAEVTVYHSTPILAGTQSELIRIYNQTDGVLYEIHPDGAFIIAPNDTLEISYVTTGTAGIVTASVLFYMEPIGSG